jgi:putative nucleotidyltransferase with HDIG domain
VSIDKQGVRKRVEALRSVPTLPGVFEKISRMMDSSETATEAVANIISSDQALSAKVLRVVNSALYGFPGRISNVTHALIILGFDVVKGLVLSTSVFDMMLAKGFHGLWKHSLGCAVVAGIISRKTNDPNPEEVSIGGLLHDLGKVIIAIELPEESTQIDQVVEEEQIPTYQAEDKVLGFSHAHVGHWLSQKWNLPNNLADPIRYHHNPNLSKSAQKPTAIVHVADILVRGIGFGGVGDNRVSQIDHKAWETLDISDSLLEEIVSEMDDKLDDAEDFFSSDGI